MLGGCRDLELIARYNNGMRRYSDDGNTLYGAYGYRWRFAYGYDQLDRIAKALKEDPDCRQQVLSMWDPSDLGATTKDLPCNTHCYLERDEAGALNLMVCNRSNDLVWGALGADYVTFSTLLEYMAAKIGCPVGQYFQVTNNLHGYESTCQPLLGLSGVNPLNAAKADPYQIEQVKPFPLIEGDVSDWEEDLQMFLVEGVDALGYKTRFFRRVALPIEAAHKHWRDSAQEGVNRYDGALDILQQCEAKDWQFGCSQWLVQRRMNYVTEQEKENKE